MRSLHIEVGKGNGHRNRSQRAVRLSFDGERKARLQLMLHEIDELAAIAEAGCNALGVHYSISFPNQRTQCDTD